MGKWQNDTDTRIIRLKLVLSHLFLNLFVQAVRRSRLSANGQLFTCLFNGNGHDIRDFMRTGVSDEDLQARIIEIWQGRSDRYSDERTAETVANRKKIEMSYIGG